MNKDEWEAININLTSTFLLSKYVIKNAYETGKIINIISGHGNLGQEIRKRWSYFNVKKFIT